MAINASQFPLLMLPLDKDDGSYGCRFFSLKDNTALALYGFPEAFSDSRCVGSSHGWLVLLDKDSKPYLLDPLHSGRIFPLPPAETFPGVLQVLRSGGSHNSCSSAGFHEGLRLGCRRSTAPLPLLSLRDYVISKAVLSADPNGNAKGKSCWVVGMFGIESKVAFCCCNDFGGVGVWTELTGNEGSYSDIIFYEGTFFALCDSGFVEVWDFNGNHPMKIIEIKSSFQQISAVAALVKELMLTPRGR